MSGTFSTFDGKNDTDKFNSEYKNSIPNAETSDMKKKVKSESF